MHKISLCFLLGMGFTNISHADSVKLYGLIDQGIQVNLNGPNATQDDIKIKQGNKMASRFGMQGRDEFAPSHIVFFNLEGETNPSSPSILFKRRNYIGYENRQVGQFTLGLQSSVSFDIARLIDPSGLIRQKYVIDDLSGTFNGRYGNKWVDNALKYSFRTPRFNFITTYQLGSTEHSHQPNFAVGTSYQMGDTLIAGSYSMSQNNRLTNHHQSSQIFNAGISQKIGNINLKLGFSQSSLSNGLSSASPTGRHHQSQVQSVKNIGIGFKYQVSPQVDFIAAAYRQKTNLYPNSSLYGNKLVIGGNYHLSKQTHLYAFVNHANGSDSGKVITDLTSGTVGIVHRF